MNVYPVFAVAKISHKSLPLSTATTVPPSDGVFAAVTMLTAETAEKVAVQAVAAVAVTVVVALEAEVGV